MLVLVWSSAERFVLRCQLQVFLLLFVPSFDFWFFFPVLDFASLSSVFFFLLFFVFLFNFHFGVFIKCFPLLLLLFFVFLFHFLFHVFVKCFPFLWILFFVFLFNFCSSVFINVNVFLSIVLFLSKSFKLLHFYQDISFCLLFVPYLLILMLTFFSFRESFSPIGYSHITRLR